VVRLEAVLDSTDEEVGLEVAVLEVATGDATLELRAVGV
jgi:hypothetical protein